MLGRPDLPMIPRDHQTCNPCPPPARNSVVRGIFGPQTGSSGAGNADEPTGGETAEAAAAAAGAAAAGAVAGGETKAAGGDTNHGGAEKGTTQVR